MNCTKRQQRCMRITTIKTFQRIDRMAKVLPERVMSTKVPRMYSGKSGIMAVCKTLSIIPAKSFIASYRVVPISLPFIAERHSPRIKASTTAESVSNSGGMEMLKKALTD